MPRRSKGPRLVTRRGKENYYVRYNDALTGKLRDITTGTSSREEAEEFLEDFLREQRSVRLGLAVAAHRMTVAQVLVDYANYKLGEPNADRLGYSMRHLLDFWGNQTLDHVNVESVKKYELQSPRSSSTVRRELTDLRSAINHAIRMNRLASFSFPELPKESEPRDRWLKESEFAKLLCASRKVVLARYTLRLFLIIAFYTGQRKGAIMELEWKQIDFERGIIDFNKPGRKKTKKKRARIPMPPQIERFLIRRFERFGEKTRWVFHQKHDPIKRVKSINKGFRQAAAIAGMPDVTPHTLRHTRASLLAQNGWAIHDVSAYLNMSFQTLEQVYLHHNPDHLRNLANNIRGSR